jgi:hypothetical protein
MTRTIKLAAASVISVASGFPALRSFPSSAELIARVNSVRTSSEDFANIAITATRSAPTSASQLTYLVVGGHDRSSYCGTSLNLLRRQVKAILLQRGRKDKVTRTELG